MGMRRRKKDSKEEKRKLSADDFKKALTIFKYVLPYKWAFFLGMFFLAAGSIVFLVIMKVPGEMINIISGESKYGVGLNQLFLVLLVFLGVQSLFAYFRVQLFALVSEKSMALLRSDLYKKLIALPILFFEERRVGELTSRITNDVTQIQGVVAVTLAEFIRQIIVLVGGLAIIIFTMPSLALTMLATFPVVVVVAMFFGRYIRNLMKQRQDQLAKTNVIVEETMQSIQTVKAYTNEKFEMGRYGQNLEEAVRISLRTARFRGLFVSFIIFVMFGALFFIMWQAAQMVQSGDMIRGDLFDFVAFTALIGGAIASLGSFYTEIVSAIGATDRILEILDMPSEFEIDTPAQSPQRYEGNIDYKGVHFSYPTRKDVPVLKGIDLSIQSGQKVALVGASGSGKSTIVQLLLRFYELDEGEIQVDGKDIADYDLPEFRSNIAIVPQEVLLFGGTIRENIAYGRPNATEEEIISAAEQANAWA
ncbi:MAG: ABC transporter transmembrane domain-containing protein, partial [Saprospiraceae bacterium]|nr:ABC transporter transmembrane domain-containing protein [Saprospiraceae bacterium]